MAKKYNRIEKNGKEHGRMRRKTRRRLLLIALLLAAGLSGCTKQEQKFQKTGEVEYTVMEEGAVPKELLEVIREKQQEPFRLTFLTEDSLYLVQGYGEKPTGGYSVVVSDLFSAQEGICVKTTLLGPAKDDKVTATKTFPYIVIRIQAVDSEVFFLN